MAIERRPPSGTSAGAELHTGKNPRWKGRGALERRDYSHLNWAVPLWQTIVFLGAFQGQI
jgi:hypothetical protein